MGGLDRKTFGNPCVWIKNSPAQLWVAPERKKRGRGGVKFNTTNGLICPENRFMASAVSTSR